MNLLNRFLLSPSLFNAIALVKHCERNPAVLSLMNDAQLGDLHSAQLMIDNVERDARNGNLIRLT